MSDAEQKTPNMTGASGAAWSEAEKIAYLIVLCENEGRIDAKIGNAPIPAGRSIVSCKKLLVRLKQKHKNDIEKIKNGLPLSTASADVEATAIPEKPKATPRKRKSKIVEGADANSEDGVAEGSPKKKVTPRPRKKKGEVVEEVKSESIEDEEMI
ncbi:uncharacterized protein ALTATR162_LOCUS11224 [Alternaria atra]|uniref:Uncharacterized protein n=1 Tax=Alternaria atra TaxID=119953 RepID=A0A8J2IAN5_9PLEO|nr:uncharacterized protein ALTATR162_LOCUS11224 [Alternaria atra]CAG5185109.1 unnamed protein product [Alternaria atra]